MLDGINAKVALGAAIVLLLGFLLLGKKDKGTSSYVAFILLLSLGYRSYRITERLQITPAECLVWLSVLFCLSQHRKKMAVSPTRLPIWLVLMVPIWILTSVNSIGNSAGWDEGLSELRNFVMAVPIFFATGALVGRLCSWDRIAGVLLGMGSWIAFMGSLEYVYPGIKNVVPGFIKNTTTINADEFQRARFAFYGNPMAVYVCVLVAPLFSFKWARSGSRKERILLSLGLLLYCYAIYISGFRSMWFLVSIQVATILVYQKRFALLVGMAALGMGSYPLLPAATQTRIHSLVRVAQAKPLETDTSGRKRWGRAKAALDTALENPLGIGWGGSGWVHSDILQIAANQGIAGAIVFAGGYCSSLLALTRLLVGRRSEKDTVTLILPLLCSFLAAGGILLFEGVEFLPFTIMPVWLIWSLVHVAANQARRGELVLGASTTRASGAPGRRRTLFAPSPRGLCLARRG